jgi:hypothetical protein
MSASRSNAGGQYRLQTGPEQQLILSPSEYALMTVGSTKTTAARAIQLAVLRQAFVSRLGDRG